MFKVEYIYRDVVINIYIVYMCVSIYLHILRGNIYIYIFIFISLYFYPQISDL